jgi:hypothetical protein
MLARLEESFKDFSHQTWPRTPDPGQQPDDANPGCPLQDP